MEGLASLCRVPGRARVSTLDNGLTVCLLENQQAPLVSTALWYRVGAGDEPDELAGAAHFLEHMMFKGSARYPAGEIDRLTRELGGSNNAFTSHDSTAYYFAFSNDRWHAALEIEADRMAGLNLDPTEVDLERRVIEEELTMYEDDAWAALDRDVYREFFGHHPYGRPILGTREALGGIGADELRAFHTNFYRPENAVLVVAGAFGSAALEKVERSFGELRSSPPARPASQEAETPTTTRRVERRKGDVGRFLLALPSPGADHPEYAPLRLLLTALSGPRTSRLASALVEERQLCVSVSTEITETVEPGMAFVAAELLPGVDPAEVEERVFVELGRLRREPLTSDEVERAQRILASDWIFGMERIQQQALATGMALSLFDLDYPGRHLRRALGCDAGQLAEIGQRWIRPTESAVVGWSLPE